MVAGKKDNKENKLYLTLLYNNMFYVYILQSIKDEKFYVGFSADLKERIKEHSTGKVTSTKSRRPMILIYYEAYRSGKDARIREIFLKTGQGREFINKNIIHSRVSAQSAQGGPAAGGGGPA